MTKLTITFAGALVFAGLLLSICLITGRPLVGSDTFSDVFEIKEQEYGSYWKRVKYTFVDSKEKNNGIKKL